MISGVGGAGQVSAMTGRTQAADNAPKESAAGGPKATGQDTVSISDAAKEMAGAMQAGGVDSDGDSDKG